MEKKIKNLSHLKWKCCQHAMQFEDSCPLKDKKRKEKKRGV